MVGCVVAVVPTMVAIVSGVQSVVIIQSIVFIVSPIKHSFKHSLMECFEEIRRGKLIDR